jgi:2-methylcitrate dehydratase PrpD
MAKQSAISAEMKALSTYMARAMTRRLPPKVVEKAKHHILDTLAAIISGSRLVPGEKATSFIRTQGGKKEALVLGSGYMTTAINAAMTNAIMAHADETDDSHFRANMHPGSIMVPSALAIAERNGLSGEAFLKSVVLGYDVGCRCNMALDATNLRRMEFDSHSFGGSFGAGAAAASLLGLNAEQMRFVLSYAAQQTSGLRTWRRDPEHVEKAFVFSGMSARNGVTAALMIEDGFTGVDDVFSGDPNYLDIFVDKPKRKELSDELGKRHEVIYTNIKKWSVGSPIQSALDGTQALILKHDIAAEDVESVLIHLPTERVKVVDNRDMPDINLQHLTAIMLLKRTVSFLSSHDYGRMNDRITKALRKRVSLKASDMLSRARPGRQAIVEIVRKDGRKFKERIRAVRGTADNPMTRQEVEDKAVDLLVPVLGTARTKKLIQRIWSLEKVRDVRTLQPLLKA